MDKWNDTASISIAIVVTKNKKGARIMNTYMLKQPWHLTSCTQKKHD